MGLFPFPRVGRSDPDLIPEWDSYSSFENYDGNYYNDINWDFFQISTLQISHRFGSS